MGRKIKPLGLRRKPISISLPLDVISWLDRIVLAKEGGTRSRTIESLLRASMLKGQTTLKRIITKWECSGCGNAWETFERGFNYIYCDECNRQQDPKLDMKGQRIAAEEEE